MERKIGSGTSGAETKGPEIPLVIILLWIILLLLTAMGCFMKPLPDPNSVEFYQGMHERCQNEKLELLILLDQCENDLTLCKKLASSLEACP